MEVSCHDEHLLASRERSDQLDRQRGIELYRDYTARVTSQLHGQDAVAGSYLDNEI
jgi:hypothetical protein